MDKALAKNTTRRRYLTGAERKREILDAALVEFLNHGYVETSVQNIATRAGLSKSGIYAHYKSKEEIFETLLTTTLLSPSDSFGAFEPELDKPLPEIIETYIDRLYERLENPQTVPTFQLLIAESKRIPDLIERWSSNVLLPMNKSSQDAVNEYVKQGLLRDSVLTEHFLTVVFPIVYWLVKSVLLGEEAIVSLDKMREIHKRLLLELLPSSPAAPTALTAKNN